MATIHKLASSLLLFFALFLIPTEANNPITPKPHILETLKIENNPIEISRSSCSYTIRIKTSCSSTRYTRDSISLAFSDAYGHQVYVPRLDDPSSGAFESCSTDTYQVSGPCMSRICSLYLSRTGSDGWEPESVTVGGSYTEAVTFYYNTFLPYRTWFGFDLCGRASMGVNRVECWIVLCVGLFLWLIQVVM